MQLRQLADMQITRKAYFVQGFRYDNAVVEKAFTTKREAIACGRRLRRANYSVDVSRMWYASMQNEFIPL